MIFDIELLWFVRHANHISVENLVQSLVQISASYVLSGEEEYKLINKQQMQSIVSVSLHA